MLKSRQEQSHGDESDISNEGETRVPIPEEGVGSREGSIASDVGRTVLFSSRVDNEGNVQITWQVRARALL